MTENYRIWLIGGTQESAELARAIAVAQLPCTISVTTESARSLYPSHPLLRVWVGKLNPQTIADFLHHQNAIAILDASHPYAVEISQLAIATATCHHLPYLRYERESVENQNTNPERSHNILQLDRFETLVTGNYLTSKRVLLTVGYRTLPLFHPWQERSHLFARILPSTTALQAALAAGFTPDRLIAIRPPISLDLERSLWQHWQIQTLVAKASGAPGGENIKRQLATELDVQLILIARPKIDYPQHTHQLSDALTFCQQHFSHRKPYP